MGNQQGNMPNTKRPLGSPLDLNNSDQWRERNVVVTSYQHQENTESVKQILNDLVDDLPCFKDDGIGTEFNESHAISPSINTSQCLDISKGDSATEVASNSANFVTQEVEETEKYYDPLLNTQCPTSYVPEVKELNSSVDVTDVNVSLNVSPKINKSLATPPKSDLAPQPDCPTTPKTLSDLAEKVVNERRTLVSQLDLDTDCGKSADVRNLTEEDAPSSEKLEVSNVISSKFSPKSLACLATEKRLSVIANEASVSTNEIAGVSQISTRSKLEDLQLDIQKLLESTERSTTPVSFSPDSSTIGVIKECAISNEISEIANTQEPSNELNKSETLNTTPVIHTAPTQITEVVQLLEANEEPQITEVVQLPEAKEEPEITEVVQLPEAIEEPRITETAKLPEVNEDLSFKSTSQGDLSFKSTNQDDLSFKSTNQDVSIIEASEPSTTTPNLPEENIPESSGDTSINIKPEERVKATTASEALTQKTDEESEEFSEPLSKSLPKQEEPLKVEELILCQPVEEIAELPLDQSGQFSVQENFEFASAINQDCLDFNLNVATPPKEPCELDNNSSNVRESSVPMPTPVGDVDLEYEGNEKTPVDTDFVNDNVQNSSFLISGDKPKMEFDENINPFETRSKLNSETMQNENIISQQVTNAMRLDSTESSNSPPPHKNSATLPSNDYIAGNIDQECHKLQNQDEDEGVTVDSEKDNLVSAATAFEDYAENLDSGICDHIETTKLDAKAEGDFAGETVGVASVNRRGTFKKSSPHLPVDSNPESPSHSNLIINETLSGTSSPDLSLGASAPLINHSEAGPEVAQFTEDEFRSAAEVFKDPADFDFLLRAGSSQVLKESTLSRLSLYVKFDPLVKKPSSPGKPLKPTNKTPEKTQSSNSVQPTDNTEQLDNTLNSKKNLNSTKLIEFDSPKHVKQEKPPPKMVPVEPMQRLGDNQADSGKFFTEEDMKKALQIHDLLYQERLLKKEKEGVEKEQIFKAEITELQRHVKLQADCLSCTRKLLHETTKMSKLWREKKEQERVEQTKERDQALEDLQSVETAFGDLHKRYEKTKAILEGYKQKENELRQELLDCQEKLHKQEQMYEALRSRTEEQLEGANVEIENAKKSGSSELAVLSAQLRKSEMKVASLERTLVQKEQEYDELSRGYDDLIARFESHSN